MVLKEFVFKIASLDGEVYELAVPARELADAERLLENYFTATSSEDKIVSLSRSPHS